MLDTVGRKYWSEDKWHCILNIIGALWHVGNTDDVWLELKEYPPFERGNYMAKEILVVPETRLREVIIIIRAGLEKACEFDLDVSSETIKNLSSWCDQEEEYLGRNERYQMSRQHKERTI